MATVAKSAGKASKAAKASDAGLVERAKGWPSRFRTFYEGIKREMKLVTWPTRTQVQSTTLVVLVTVFLFALYFGVVDLALSRGMRNLYQYFTQ